jgi:glutathione peroxidase-family protein
MVNNTGTQGNASIIQIDTSINAPIGVATSPSGWTNSFNISWTNPSDLAGIAGVFYKLDSAPISNSNGTYIAGAGINKLSGITVSSSGVHIVYIWLKDAAGNVDFNKYNTTNLYFDNLINAPIGVSASPSGWTDANSFNVTWTNPADLSGIVGVYYKLDAPPISNTDGIYIIGIGINTIRGINVSGDGTHLIYLWLKDAVGNINYNNFNTTLLLFDSTIGKPTSFMATPGTWTAMNKFNLTWTNPSDLSGIVGAYYKLDSPPCSNTNGIYIAGAGINAIWGITVSGDGVHPIYLWLVDAAGNINFTKYNSVMLRFDGSIEIPPRLIASPGRWTNLNKFNLTWTNPSNSSGIVSAYYKLDSPPLSNTDGTIVLGTNISIITGITVSGDGAHPIFVWLKDAVGNIDFNKYNVTLLQIDRIIEAPSGVLAWPIEWTYINNFNLTWANPSDQSGISGVYYKLDSPPLSNVDGTYVAGAGINTITGITVSGDGAHPIFIWLVDAAGNVQFSKYSVTVLHFGSSSTLPPTTVDPAVLLTAAAIIGAALIVHGLLIRKRPSGSTAVGKKSKGTLKPPKNPSQTPISTESNTKEKIDRK